MQKLYLGAKQSLTLEASPTIAILVIIFPLVAAVGMIWFMMSGKGKPAPTQDEILEAKRRKQRENQSPE